MRLKERIPNFLQLVNMEALGWNIPKLNEDDLKHLEEFWLDNADLRFSQVLINKGIIPNTPGMWYYKEEDDILIEQGHEPRDVLFWGRNYDKDMNRLPSTEWILIKDLGTEHIKAIIDGNYTQNPKYLQTFKTELEIRNQKI